MTKAGDLIILAARKQAEGELAVHQANIEVYLENPVGIGEHPQVIEEMDKLIRTISDANGYLETLDKIFVQTDEGTTMGQTGPLND